MEGSIFINEAINRGIEQYFKYKDRVEAKEFHTFLVTVIKSLILIYGELDIINPYKTKNERGFDNNLKKFGLSNEQVEVFKRELLQFEQNTGNLVLQKEKFLNIEKILIDMFAFRKKSVPVRDDETATFKTLLYLKNDINPFKRELYNLYTPESDILLHYFNNKLFEASHTFTFTEFNEIALSAEAYQLAGFNAVEVMRLKEEEIENVNNKVYHFFRIKENDLNKRGRLEEAINYYKKYGNTITTGNGYVDLLFFLSILATCLMLVVLLGIQFMG